MVISSPNKKPETSGFWQCSNMDEADFWPAICVLLRNENFWHSEPNETTIFFICWFMDHHFLRKNLSSCKWDHHHFLTGVGSTNFWSTEKPPKKMHASPTMDFHPTTNRVDKGEPRHFPQPQPTQSPPKKTSRLPNQQLAVDLITSVVFFQGVFSPLAELKSAPGSF